jgi:DHA1 family bicyclomycin/chloramphenicol resistance-like MFS transporter
MKNQGQRAGSASALIGMLPLVLGSAVSPLVSIDETTAVPMGTILFVTSFIGFIAFFTLTKEKTKRCRTNLNLHAEG